jgi:hypothetical protein
VSPSQVLEILLAEFGLERNKTTAEAGSSRTSQGPGFIVAAGDLNPMSRAIHREELGIDPNVSVQLTLRKSGDSPLAMTNMLRGVLAVLRKVSGDAVLVALGGQVFLLRKEGKLLLDKATTGLWTQERLELVGMPHELRNLPVM